MSTRRRRLTAQGSRFAGIVDGGRLTASWHLYIAECADGSYYTGIAKDVEKRIEAHNSGKGSKYTRVHRPVRLVFQEPQAGYSQALKREYQVKQVPKSRKARLIAGETLPPPAPAARMSFMKPGKRKPKRRRRKKGNRAKKSKTIF